MSNKPKKKFTERQRILIFCISLSAILGTLIFVMRLFSPKNHYWGMELGALVYIALPTFIALVFARSKANESASTTVYGSTMKTITFVILLSGPILQEGFVCMIMAAPILYIIGALVASPFDKARARRDNNSELKLYILPAILLLISLEGVFEETRFNRSISVENSQIINNSVADIKNKLASNRPLASPDAFIVNFFPRPEMIEANGLDVGSTQTVDISYFKWVFWNEKRGSIQFEVVQKNNNVITFKPIKDDSYLTTYLTWNNSVVTLQKISNYRTRVTWRIDFERNIHPAWYVQPLERYAVASAAQMMVSSLR